MVTLPRPDVGVTTSDKSDDGKQKISVVISRDNKAKTYEAENYTTAKSVQEVVEKIINDPLTREWLP
jgi:hypothetical protein